MATNNVLNLKSSGIASYDGAGAFSALANPLIVANGGLGSASHTSYAVLTGGTTSTAAVQSVSGVGNQFQLLTSAGAGALPTWSNSGAKYTAFWRIAEAGTILDSTTYYLVSDFPLDWSTTVNSTAASRFYLPSPGTITAVYGNVLVKGTLASAQNVTIALRLNNTTDYTITAASQWTATNNTFNNTGLSIAVVAGDYIQCKVTTPIWTTNPTYADISVSVLIT